MALVEVALRGAVLVVLLLGVASVWWLDRPAGRWSDRARQRLILGVPWGTLVAAGMVLAVYLYVQGGAADWRDPVTLPFFSWSYFYPLGVVLAPFSHMSAGHLTGNLLGTIFIAPVAEYAWSHFPVDRGQTSFATLRSNPYLRAFVLFPAGVLAVGILTSVLHWGPVIGFSGVVYAFAGFAIVRYPATTLIVVLLDRFADTVYDALRDPIIEAEASTGFNTPWFVDIAVQGHLVGFLIGALLGVAVLYRRSDPGRPSALRVGTATVLFGSLLSPLWALWWIRGPDSYVLHRGAGVVMLVVLGLLLAIGVRATTRSRVGGVSLRTVALLLLVLPILTMGIVAVPINATAVDGPPPSDGSVTVRDYTVTYVEDVRRPKTQVLDLSILGETSEVITSGVIVTSDSRELWTRHVSPGRLAFSGYASVTVGGVGWREEVEVRRVGWSMLEGGSVYQVFIRPPEGEYRSVFTSESAMAGVILAGRNVSLQAVDGNFEFVVRRGNTTLGRTGIPGNGASTEAGGIRFGRQGGTVHATVNGTRVPIASRDDSN